MKTKTTLSTKIKTTKKQTTKSKSALQEARRVLDAEAQSILRAKSRLGTSFEKAIDLLEKNVKAGGKVIVTGVGKSGKIAAKVAATLSSLGTPAVFLHPNDGAHGDLGFLRESDCILLFSNSGNTDELITLLPKFRTLGNTIIAIVGNLEGTLAKKANVALDGSVEKEACAFNLAPTSSTTVALALGDALAIVLSQRLDFKEDHFAFNHPGGPLGRRLNLLVCDLINPNSGAAWVDSDAEIGTVIDCLTKHNLGAVLVRPKTKSNDKTKNGYPLIGIITDGDLRRATKHKEDFFSLKANEVMTKTPITARLEDRAIHALSLMENRKSQINVLPVMNEFGFCVGLLRLHDIIGRI